MYKILFFKAIEYENNFYSVRYFNKKAPPTMQTEPSISALL